MTTHPRSQREWGQSQQRLADFEKRYNANPTPFDWKFTADDLDDLLARLNQHDEHAKPTAA